MQHIFSRKSCRDRAASMPKRRRVRAGVVAMALMLLAPSVVWAGPHKVFGSHYAWINNFNDPNNVMQGSFGSGSQAEMTVTFNYPDYDLYGYPAIIRGWHYDWNPTGDTLFPKKVSTIKSIPVSFGYQAGGTNLGGDFAYDIFFRRDTSKGTPQLEVMIWGDHNSWPIGTQTATNVITAGGRTFDLWEGYNSGAGYYVYTFIPHGSAGQAKLVTSGSLNLDVKPFLNWLQSNRSKDGYYNDSMYVHSVEAGFEVIRGNGWAYFNASINAN